MINRGNICVYGAASPEIDNSYIEDCEKLGKLIAKAGYGLVFGGGNCGMMGAAARGAKSEGGSVIGVAPSFFSVDGELFADCDELLTTQTMRERKQTMEEKSIAFITAAGGIGTFEEFFEMLALKQLGRHNMPIVLLNTNGYFEYIIASLKVAVQQGFMKRKALELFFVASTPEAAIEYIENYEPFEFNILKMRHIKI